MTKYKQIVDNKSEWKVNDSTEYYSLLNKEDQKSLEELYKNLSEKDIAGSWSLTFFDKITSSQTRSKNFHKVKYEELIRYVYKNYPYYAIHREIADYKDHVIDLLKRVCTVSVETVRIVREMEKI